MNQILAKLIMYGNLPEDSILSRLGEIYQDYNNKTKEKSALIEDVYKQIKRILVISTKYGFDENLWHNYLAFVLMMQENPFSLTLEHAKLQNGTANTFAKHDFKVFMELFNFDFSPLEKDLGVDCFQTICNYHSIQKPALMYNQNVSQKTISLSRKLESAKDEETFFSEITSFYQNVGVGMFGLNKAFRIESNPLSFIPINNMDNLTLDELIGYEIQKKKLIENTLAFVEGKKANNVLLYGDSGTGKSTSIKAIVNEFYPRGLRMIEIYKHQFKDLSGIIQEIKTRNYRFIIYMDDLSFEEFETEYKFLKAVIEGGVETKPENVLIYATSNRRHLIKETFNDRTNPDTDSDIHQNETVEEKLSLVNRFGVSILYRKPTPEEFFTIVYGLAKKAGITMSEAELKIQASRWELSHGGLSGRCATQFITYLQGIK